MANQCEIGKIMEKMSHTWVAKRCSVGRNFQLGQSFRSDVFTGPGGESFRLYCYPRGKTDRDDIRESMCIRIENQSPIEELDMAVRYTVSVKAYFEDGSLNYTLGDRIMIRVTIGIFSDRPQPVPQFFDRLVFIKVGEEGGEIVRFYAEESVLKARCPKLLPPADFSVDVEVPKLEPDIFNAVLWYLYHKKLHRNDKVAISDSNFRDPNSVGRKMIKAAKVLELEHLESLVDALFNYGSTFLVEVCVWRCKLFRKCAKADKMIMMKTKSSSRADESGEDV